MNRTVFIVMSSLSAVVALIFAALNLFLAPVAGLVGILGVAVYLAAGVALFKFSPMWPRLGWQWLLSCWAWGAGFSMVMITIAALPLVEITQKLGWAAFSASLAGAYPEEIIKTTIIAIILFQFPELNRPWHGFVTGAMVGLGFEVLENFSYGAIGSVLHMQSDFLGALGMWGMRSVAGPGLHVCISALAGFGLGCAVFLADAKYPRWFYAFAGFAAAFFVHFSWNTMVSDNTLVQVVWMFGVAAVLYPMFIACWWYCHKQAKIDNGPITMDQPISTVSRIPSYQYQYFGGRGSTNQNALQFPVQWPPSPEPPQQNSGAFRISQ